MIEILFYFEKIKNILIFLFYFFNILGNNETILKDEEEH